MNIFVYSDESGVFDKVHNQIFVFGGLVFLSKDDKDIACRKYIHAENAIRHAGGYMHSDELKASIISAKEKNKLYRSLNGFYKFGVVVEQAKVHDSIMANKKSKQRYLDFAFKIGVKRLFQQLISEGIIVPGTVDNLYFFVDEHTTATNGVYELRETLEQEFKSGMFNHDYSKFFPPLFPGMKSVQLKYCNSTSQTLVRAADIIANRIYHKALNLHAFDAFDVEANKLLVTYLPE